MKTSDNGTMQTLAPIAARLTAAARIAITTHERPDGDALGSVLGLKRLLEAAGKQACAVGVGPLGERYAFLVAPGELTAPADANIDDFDLFVVLDCGDLDRPAAFARAWAARLPTVNIDHHKSNTMFGTLNYVDTAASSVGEIVQELAGLAALPMTTPAAEALWVAIVTDTGRFAYDNTSPRALRAASSLLTHGVRTSRIDYEIYQAVSEKRLRLETRALQSLGTAEQGRVAWVALTRADFAATGCAVTDAEDLVNIPRRLRGVEVALFFCELPDTTLVKAGFRTVPPYDAAALCQTLGGGGHARAAGCSFDHHPLAAARTIVLDAIHREWFA